MTDTNETKTNPEEVARPRAMYTVLLPQIDAVVTPAKIVLDVPTCVATALGILPNIAQFQEPAKKLPEYDASCFEKLEPITRALSHAHMLHDVAQEPQDPLTNESAEAVAERQTLLNDVRALASHGYIEPSRIAEMERGLGHKGVAYDLAKLVEIFRERWSVVSGKTAMTLAELTRLEMLSDKLITDVGVREQTPAEQNLAALRRQKAFTLFLETYDEVRRAITFLRWHQDDADVFAPSLYSGRGNVRRKDQPVQPAPAPVAPANPPAPVVQSAPVAPGLPGARPFTNG
jgi:hypothetical protein